MFRDSRTAPVTPSIETSSTAPPRPRRAEASSGLSSEVATIVAPAPSTAAPSTPVETEMHSTAERATECQPMTRQAHAIPSMSTSAAEMHAAAASSTCSSASGVSVPRSSEGAASLRQLQ